MKINRFLDQFEVILLDQGRTFMFDNDRFEESDDCFSTYENLGGRCLSPVALRMVIGQLYDYLLRLERSPSYYDSFPSIPIALRETDAWPFEDPDDAERIADLFALHELGAISERHINALRILARSHRLGIVSNVWGPKKRFEENLKNAGVYECFELCVWSSDHGAIKPSVKLFRQALDYFRVPPSKVLFVGDHPMRDVDAAKAIGCGAIWVQNDDEAFPGNLRPPDLTVHHLDELIESSNAVQPPAIHHAFTFPDPC